MLRAHESQVLSRNPFLPAVATLVTSLECKYFRLSSVDTGIYKKARFMNKAPIEVGNSVLLERKVEFSQYIWFKERNSRPF